MSHSTASAGVESESVPSSTSLVLTNSRTSSSCAGAVWSVAITAIVQRQVTICYNYLNVNTG